MVKKTRKVPNFMKVNAPNILIVAPQSKYKITNPHHQRLFRYFSTKAATAKMAEEYLGLTDGQVTGFKTKFLKTGDVVNLYKKKCKTNGQLVWWFTTNIDLINKYTISDKAATSNSRG